MNAPLIRFCTILAIVVPLLLTSGGVDNADHSRRNRDEH